MPCEISLQPWGMRKPESMISNFEIRIAKFHFITFVLLPFFLLLSSCESELLLKQKDEIQKMQQEIARQREEIEELKLARIKADQKRQDCNRAIRDFEKAQKLKDPEQAISLYREGLRLCPDDDVAHYELGKILVVVGQIKEAEEEFEIALGINPDFESARRELKALQEKK